MAEVSKINQSIQTPETTKPEPHQTVKGAESKARECPYVKGMKCTIPDLKMKVCQNCPYAQLYILKNVFKKIVGQAIFFIKGDRAVKDIFKSSMNEINKGNS